jgi:hypothetical protein
MHECRGRRHAQERLTWAQRLKRVFRVDIERCERCGGNVRIIGGIEDPAVVARILAPLEKAPAPAGIAAAHRPRGPPGQGQLEFS